MAESKDELADLDEAWEAPIPESLAQPASLTSLPPDLGDLDDGWADAPIPAAAVAAERPDTPETVGTNQEPAQTPATPWLTKKQRREIEKQQRRHATQRRAERKQARKQERREEAKQRVVERRQARAKSTTSPDTGAGHARDAVSKPAPTTLAQNKARVPSPSAGKARRESERKEPVHPSGRPETKQPKPSPQTSKPAHAAARPKASQRETPRRQPGSLAIYVLVAVAVAALIVWVWLR